MPPKQSQVKIFVDRFLTEWAGLRALTEPWLLILFFAALALICGMTAATGAVPTRVFGHDVFVPLDGGWRVLNGQRPHLDFMSPWGPVWFLVEALGLAISRHSVNGIGYANAIVALVVATWSFFLGKSRLAAFPRIMLGWFLAVLVAAPYPLGESPFQPSHAMTYNRYGYALLALILLECLTPARGPNDSEREEGWAGGLSTGAALSLALFLKASYFLMGVLLIAVLSPLLGRLARRRFLAIALGFSLITICLLAYLRFDVAAVLADLRMAGATRAAALNPKIILSNAAHLSTSLRMAFFAFVCTLLFDERVPRWRGLTLLGIAVLLFLADVGLMSTNGQSRGFPLCVVFAIVLVSEVARDQRSLPAAQRHSYRGLYLTALMLAALLVLPQFTSDMSGLGYGAWSKYRLSSQRAAPRFTSPNLRSLVLYDNGSRPQSNGVPFINYVNDGVALLQYQSHADESIITIDMTNPFSYALERQPPRAGIESPTYHLNIDDDHRPSDDRFFGDADIVMVPKRAAVDRVNFVGFYRAYEPGLKRRYYLAAETDLWWMYRRK